MKTSVFAEILANLGQQEQLQIPHPAQFAGIRDDRGALGGELTRMFIRWLDGDAR
jgi:hypothetical protein